MSESNCNWVCFACRVVIRQARTYPITPQCQQCQKDCVCLGCTIPIPKKRDSKGWKGLQQTYRQMRLSDLELQRKSTDWSISHLKDEIQRLTSKEQNKERDKLITTMREELEKLQRQKNR